jgi:vacuolar-type H+-ATPase subunit B/Vma2
MRAGVPGKAPVAGFLAVLSSEHSGGPGIPNCQLLRRRDTGTLRRTKLYLCRELTHPNEIAPMHTLPVDRALSIYGALADRSETKGAREQLSRHLMKLYIDGEKDRHRLTVHGLSYLRELDRKIDAGS